MNLYMRNHAINHLLDVDSYGCIFMYATHCDLTTAPRHIIRMSEPVRPEELREALKIALLRFPQMGLGLVRGEKQYRYRLLDKPPVVLPFEDISPYYIGSDDTNGYLFTCGYKGNTIYLEYQHCTSDGRGWNEFIKCVLYYYLKLCGKPVENDGSIRTLETDYQQEENEDGFIKLRKARQSADNYYPDVPALHLPEFDGMEDSNEWTAEITIPFPRLHKFVKANEISPLTLLMAAICHAVYRTYYVGTDRKDAIVAEVPMDLRTYIKSPTVRFFVALLDLPFHYEYFSLPIVEAAQKMSEYFDTQRALPHAAFWALKNAARVQNGHQADMPIDEKERMMREQARAYIRRDSFILTNIGPFRVPVSMEPYIEDYGAILPCAHQPFGVLVSSYRDTLKISLSQRDARPDMMNHLVDVLGELGFPARTKRYEFHVTRYDGKHLAK